MFTRIRTALARTIAPRPTAVRRFDGAAGGRRGWGIGTMGRINSEVAAAGPQLRSRARYLAANNPWLTQAVANWVGALVGSGIMPTPKHPNADIRKALAEGWGDWCDVADADGRTDFHGLLADIARGLVIDGEAFVQILGNESGAPRLRLIPPELVDESMTRELGYGRMIVSGVEFDADGRRAAYWVLPSRPTDQFATYAPAVRIPADDILHVMKPIAAGQVRGASWLAPVILPASEFDQLCDALLMGAKIAAMHAGFLVDQNGTGEPYDGTGTGGILETGLEPGTLKRLPAGLDVKFNTPEQAQELGAFIRLNLQQLAAGLGLPEHMLSGDLSNANYSSLRAGLLPFRQRVEQTQYGTLVPQLLRPLWHRVTTFEVLSGALDVDDLESAFRVDWIMPRPLQVDPYKDAQAVREMLGLRLMSRRQAVAEMGWDIESLDEEIAADRQRESALGIAPTENPKKPKPKDKEEEPGE